MDPIRNPYTPGAGTRPSELAGRGEEIENFKILLARLRAGRSEQSQIVTGLRGVGKTVLLNTFENLAEDGGYHTAFRELTQETSLPELLAKDVQRLLRELKLSAKVADAVRAGLSTLSAFKLTDPNGFELSIDTRKPSEQRLTDEFIELFIQLGRAAKAKNVGIAFFMDEIQFVKEAEFRALISALHRAAQKELPVTLAAAGLPQIPRLAGEARSYAERLFRFPRIGALDESAARAALIIPAEREGALYEEEAIVRALELTQGYPFYLQEFGKHIWNLAATSPITRTDVESATPRAEESLDRGIYEVRIQRATVKERRYLRAMAELGAGPYKAGAVASAMGSTTTALSTVRQKLLDRGLIYATEDYGHVDFTVPRFDEFMRRHMPYKKPAMRTTPPRGAGTK
jgi:AAA+ ATPase superfamily predicted ATPase